MRQNGRVQPAAKGRTRGLETVVTSVGYKIQRRDLINSRHAPLTMRLS